MLWLVPHFGVCCAYFCAKKTDMELIGSWNEFLEYRANLFGHLADVAKKCWHHEYIIGNYCEKYGDTYCRAGGSKSKVFQLKDKRMFYGAVRKMPKEPFLHLYMAAAKYLPGVVGRYANELGFKDYAGTRVQYRYNGLPACCYPDKYIGYDFLFLLLENEKYTYSTIIHELCHTVHFNHKLGFWKLYERKIKEVALVEQDYDGWPSTDWEWECRTNHYMYQSPLEWRFLPCGCMVGESVEVYQSQFWYEFNDKVMPTLRRIIRKKLQECYEEGLTKEYAQLYGVDYMSLF